MSDKKNPVRLECDEDEWMAGWKSGVLGEPFIPGRGGMWFSSGRVEGLAEREFAEKEGRPIRLPQLRRMPKDQ